MTGKGRRKWLPNEAYRLLVLAALAHRSGGPATKGELAREVRANHYVITKALAGLVHAGHVSIEDGQRGLAIHATADGLSFWREHRAVLGAMHAASLQAHFRYGRRPQWAHF